MAVMKVVSCENRNEECSVPDEEEIIVEPINAEVMESVCTICNVNFAVIACSGSECHLFCSECLHGYARSNFELTGEYHRSRKSNNNDDFVSLPGQLPCPHFISADCTCAALDLSILRRLLDDDVFELWRQADVRIGVSAWEKETRAAEELMQSVEEQRTPLETLKLAVQESLTRGSTVSCPQCSTNGEKDDQCMHIKCSNCGIDWCYCCGRKRGVGITSGTCTKENGCDSASPYLESHSGWGHFAIGGETAGQGALHEFHRQRSMYFLKRLKDSTDFELWFELRVQNPQLLDNIPTAGRFIDWDSIDGAVIPTFGKTRPSEVAWNIEGTDILKQFSGQIEDAVNNERSNRRRKNQSAVLQRHFIGLFRRNEPKAIWMITCMHFITFSLLVSASMVLPNSNHQNWCLRGLCIYLILVATYLVAKCIDWRYTLLQSTEDEMVLPYTEVQFLGSHDEYPYLSSNGRWKKYRFMYLISLFSLLICGTVLVSSSHSINRRIGWTILLMTVIVFGFGSIILNLSPPPDRTNYRLRINTYNANAMTLLMLGGILLPCGIFLMLTLTSEPSVQWQCIFGSIIFGLTAAIILADFTNRCINPNGFALDQGVFWNQQKGFIFWFMTITGLLILVMGEEQIIIMVGCVLSFGPFLLFILSKICT